jgi:hypothetical protein
MTLTAAAGTSITVRGVALGTQGTLLIDGEPVAVAPWTDTSVTFTVPEGLPPGEVSLQASVHGYLTAPVTLVVT